MGVPMDKKLPTLSFTSDRRFGLELELLSFDGKNRPPAGHKPEGIDYVGMLVARNSSEGIDIREWEHTQGNDVWVVKPDSSCGMEVCTPIMKGWGGLKKCCQVVEAFSKDPKIKIDNRCSVHAHIEIADLTIEQMGTIVAYWLKTEPVFMDAMPPNRKRNRYCQFMGLTNIIEHNTEIGPVDLVKKVGTVKYYSVNTNQFIRNGRKTIEFRVIEGEGVKDPYLIKNWVRLIIHFVEMTKNLPYPGPYKEGDPWSSFCWLDPEDTFKLLGFSNNPKAYELSPGLQQTRNWFLARLQRYMAKDELRGPRYYAYQELKQMLNRFAEQGVVITPDKHLSPSDLTDALYDESAKI